MIFDEIYKKFFEIFAYSPKFDFMRKRIRRKTTVSGGFLKVPDF